MKLDTKTLFLSKLLEKAAKINNEAWTKTRLPFFRHLVLKEKNLCPRSLWKEMFLYTYLIITPVFTHLFPFWPQFCYQQIV